MAADTDPKVLPPEATVRMNVRSIAKALRDIALLEERGSDRTVENLRLLADRVERMYWEQEEADGA